MRFQSVNQGVGKDFASNEKCRNSKFNNYHLLSTPLTTTVLQLGSVMTTCSEVITNSDLINSINKFDYQ